MLFILQVSILSEQTFFSRREKIFDSKFFFVIIFTPFSVERYIKFYI